MKYIDADRLNAKIEKHLKEVKDAEKRFTPNLGFLDAKLSGIYEVMAIIYSLQQEQPEEDLEKAMYDKATSECDIIWNEMGFQLCYDNLIEAFVAGAEWAMKWKEDKK